MKRKKRGQLTSTRIKPVYSTIRKKHNKFPTVQIELSKLSWIIIIVCLVFLLSAIVMFMVIKDDLHQRGLAGQDGARHERGAAGIVRGRHVHGDQR